MCHKPPSEPQNLMPVDLKSTGLLKRTDRLDRSISIDLGCDTVSSKRALK